MTPKLSDATRSVWTEAYAMHEKYCEMAGTDTDWCKFANEMTLTIAKHKGADHRLAELLLLALYDHLSEEQKRREIAARDEPEQLTIRDVVPWT